MREKREKNSAPVIRFRFMLIGLALLAVIMAGPLVLVWKQSYINQLSISLESMSDSLSVLDREIASLKLQCEQLSTTERIQNIAQTTLGLSYPVSDQIVIVHCGQVQSGNGSSFSNLFAFVKRALVGEKG